MFNFKPFSLPRKYIFSTLILCSMLNLTACGGDSVEEFRAEGQQLMQEGNPNGAIVFFRNALEKDSNNIELRHDLVKAYIQANKRPQAETELEKCLIQAPTNIPILMTAVHFYTNTNGAQQALEYLEIIEKLQEPTSQTRELSGSNLRFLNRLDEAEKAYKEALNLDSTNTNAAVNLSSLYLSQQRSEEALALINSTLEKKPDNVNLIQLRALSAEDKRDFESAENDYRKIISLQPNSAASYYSLAKLLLGQGKLDEVKKIYSEMSVKFKSNIYERMVAGSIAIQEKDYNTSAEIFQQVVQDAPSVDSLYNLALSLHNINNSETALSSLRRILDVFPTNTAALQLTAQILFEQKRLPEAKYEAERLVEANPNYLNAYNILAKIQSALGEYDEALITYDKALKINPNFSQATVSSSNILFEQGKDEEAVNLLQSKLQENPASDAERISLFNYYMKNSDYKKAAELVEEGLRNQPEQSFLLVMKSNVLLAQQQNEEAIAALEKALEINPSFMPAIDILLNIFMAQGENEKALKLCETYLKANPNDANFLVTSSLLLDNLQRSDEATAKLEQANALNSERALISLVRRALNNNDAAKAEKYLTDKLKALPIAPVRSMLTSFYVEQDNLQKAIDVYNVEEIKNTAEAIAGRFRLYLSVKNYKDAKTEAELMISTFPDSPDGYVLKAFALEGEDNFDEAFKTLNSAYTKLSSSELLIQLANLCLRNEDYDKALSYFRTSLLASPDNLAAISGQGYAFHKQGKFKEAITSFERILELYPQNTANYNNLAMALADEGKNVARAVELAAQVYSQAPENINVIDTYAYTLIKNNQVDEALNVIEGGLKANPTSGLLYYRQGLALLADKKKKDALLALEKAVELGNFAELEKAKEIIAENQ